MRDPVNGDTVFKLLKELGRNCRGPGAAYIAGGTSAVVIGWRETTIDVDLKFQPEPLGVFEKIPQLKNELNVNIELASPDDFIPALPGWQERSQWIVTHNQVDFFHFDFYTQALSKMERSHVKDLTDVDEMIRAGLVDPKKLLELYQQLTAEQMARYPSIEPATIEATLKRLLDEHDGR